MALGRALDNEIAIVIEKLLQNGVKPNVNSVYLAIQKSNSSLKRRPKRVLEDSIGRVIDHLGITAEESDSEAERDQTVANSGPSVDIMNKSLRTNLSVQSKQASPAPESPPRKRKSNGEAMSKRQKTNSEGTAAPTDISLVDIGGMPEVIDQFDSTLTMPLVFTKYYLKMGTAIPRGVLLHGPPGCGKTTVTRAFAAELGLPFVQILGPSVVSGMSGESEKGIREKFAEAKKNAPCLLFIDEIDALAPKRETSQSQMEKRIVAQLLLCMDELGENQEAPVIVMAATNRPDSLDPALRRGGRFDTEICIGVPNEDMRVQILEAQTRNITLAEDVNFRVLAKSTAGFVGADLRDLVGKAGSWQMGGLREALRVQGHQAQDEMFDSTLSTGQQALSRARALIARSKLKDLSDPPGHEESAVTMEAFLAVLPQITPSSKREGFATTPNVSWSHVGALHSVREELEMAIVQPITDPERFQRIGLTAPAGVLLCGPPGCGKTLLAKAVAAESKANFISVKGPELLDKYLGESEAAVRRVFTRARASAPCIIFFDELDALAPRRDSSGSEATARIVNQLLTELDGLGDRGQVFVVGATNRPDMIDEAMMRPGRFETPIFVDLPTPDERVDILRTIFRARGVELDLAEIARRDACHGFTGADLQALWTKAAKRAIKRNGDAVSEEDLEGALGETQRSVIDPGRYEAMKRRFMGRK